MHEQEQALTQHARPCTDSFEDKTAYIAHPRCSQAVRLRCGNNRKVHASSLEKGRTNLSNLTHCCAALSD